MSQLSKIDASTYLCITVIILLVSDLFHRNANVIYKLGKKEYIRDGDSFNSIKTIHRVLLKMGEGCLVTVKNKHSILAATFSALPPPSLQPVTVKCSDKRKGIREVPFCDTLSGI